MTINITPIENGYGCSYGAHKWAEAIIKHTAEGFRIEYTFHEPNRKDPRDTVVHEGAIQNLGMVTLELAKQRAREGLEFHTSCLIGHEEKFVLR